MCEINIVLNNKIKNQTAFYNFWLLLFWINSKNISFKFKDGWERQFSLLVCRKALSNLFLDAQYVSLQMIEDYSNCMQ